MSFATGCAAHAHASAGASSSAIEDTSSSSSSPEPVATVAANDTASTSASARPPGPLTRSEVEQLLRRGLGVYLARVDVTPTLQNGHFVGFRLDRADDIDDWHSAGADVRVGDVITRVNGIRIERPEQALWAFERLRIARAIEVDVIRNGTPRTITAPILDSVASASSRPAPQE